MANGRAHMLIERLTHVLREEQRAFASAQGLPLAQLEVLRYLAAANRFSNTISALVDYLGATKGTLSQTVSALERKGLVRREASAGDRRVQHCRLTPAGEVLVRASERATRSAWSGVPEPAAESLDVLLRALLASRGGRAFGVCASCAHHRVAGENRRCALLEVPLTEADATRICREHTAAA